MSLTTPTALKTLDTGYGGEPFCSITSKTSVVTAGLNVGYGGEPFYAPGPSGPGPGGSAQVQIIIGM